MTAVAPTDLTGVDLKIGRAYGHIEDLKTAVQDAFDRSRYHFTLDFDPNSKEHAYTAHNVPAIDPKWSLMVGDFLHNARSALDHLAWQLVILDGGTPGEHTQFPVRESPFTKRGKRIPTDLQPPVSDPTILQLPGTGTRSTTSRSDSAPIRCAQRHIPHSTSGASLENTSAPAPNREYPSAPTTTYPLRV